MKFLSALGFVLSGLAAGFAGAAEIYDLEAGEITLDSSAPALITVNYSASNVGALAAPAPWWDSVYLTPDPSGATVSYRFPSTRIADDLAPGGSYARSVTSPGRLIPPGDYYIRTVIASGYYIFGEPPEPPENNLATFGPFTHSLPPGVEAVTFDMATMAFDELGLSSYSVIPPGSYDLPGLEVSYHTLTAPPDGGPPGILGGIFYFGSGYSGLPGVAIANSGSASMMFSFEPEAGRLVKIGSLDIGAFGSGRSAEVTIWNADFTEILFATGEVDISGSTPFHLEIGIVYDEAVHLVFGPDWNVGINNLVYGVSPVQAPPALRRVPFPPAALVFLALGLVTVALAGTGRETRCGGSRLRRQWP